MKLIRWMLLALVVLTIWLPSQASACAVCMGAPEAKLTQGAAWGIMTLLVIVMMVLAAIASFFIFLARKAAAFHAQAAQSLEPRRA